MTAQHAQTGTIPTTAAPTTARAVGGEPWTLDEDRALPADPATRPIARAIYAETKALPIVSMHGHVEAQVLDEDTPFGDPAELFVIPDHYLVRMIVSQGGSVDQMGVAPVDPTSAVVPNTDHRDIWRRFCASWKLYRGTPTRYWMEHELVEVFGITQRPSAETADAIYDQLDAALKSPEFRPRALFERFGIETLATTDPAWSGLEHHASLAAQGWGDKVVPTFRPDPLLHLDGHSWADSVAKLSRAAGIDVTGYASYLDALRQRRQAFIAAGARATDHGHFLADTTPLSDAEAHRIFDLALSGAQVSAAESQAFSGHMLFQMAAMSAEDGLVMQLHPGVLRNHDRTILDTFGADKGYDIPVQVEYARALRPLLEAFGHHPGLRLIVFTIDETVYSRELAPLAGVYPAMKLGAPWWFLDSPDGMRRFRDTATETAGFYNTTGFVDDTRAFASIPARHDLSRRIDAGYLARLVAEHRLDLDEAVETAVDLAYNLPREAYARR